MKKLNLSALDIVPVFDGQTPKEAIERAARIAEGLEERNFVRYLAAEHHNTLGTASSANDVVIGYILEHTSTIQVGAGGVMLPNHTPLQIAERYGTLDTLYPGRVDLGFGRAPGTDPLTSSLIARKSYGDLNEFVHDIALVLHWFKPVLQQGQVSNFAGADAKVHPLILGSSLSSAHAAAFLGLPYAFAAHINPNDAQEAARIYREEFQPSDYLDKPYLIVSVWLYAAKSNEQAEELFDLSARRFLDSLQGKKQHSSDPLTSAEKILLTQRLGTALKGDASMIASQYEQIDEMLHPDELMGVASGRTARDVLDEYDILQQALQAWL